MYDNSGVWGLEFGVSIEGRVFIITTRSKGDNLATCYPLRIFFGIKALSRASCKISKNSTLLTWYCVRNRDFALRPFWYVVCNSKNSLISKGCRIYVECSGRQSKAILYLMQNRITLIMMCDAWLL